MLKYINIDFLKIDEKWVFGADNATELAGLVANEVRYFFNKYKYKDFKAIKISDDKEIMSYINSILAERNMVFSYEPLLVSSVLIDDNISWCNVWYKNGLGVNVVYNISDPKHRAVGFKITQSMEIPSEFINKFKFAHSKSKLAGPIRGTYFIIKNEYNVPKIHDNIIKSLN